MNALLRGQPFADGSNVVDDAVPAAATSCAALHALPCCLQFWLPASIKDLRGLQPEEKQWLADRKQADKAAAQNVSKRQGTIWGESRCRCLSWTPAGRGRLTLGKERGKERKWRRGLLLLHDRQVAHAHLASAVCCSLMKHICQQGVCQQLHGALEA